MRARAFQPCDGPDRERSQSIEVRLHAPAPQVVVVRVSGVLDGVSGPLLQERVEAQFAHALDVVIDLDDVEYLADTAIGMLRTLHARAVEAGSRLHLAAEHRAICSALRSAGVDRLMPVTAAADAVVARCACEAACGRASRRCTGPMLDRVPAQPPRAAVGEVPSALVPPPRVTIGDLGADHAAGQRRHLQQVL